jgi:hypothetical protein
MKYPQIRKKRLRLTRTRSQHGRTLRRSHATNGYVGLSQPKSRNWKPPIEWGCSALGVENDAPVVGPDALTANSKMVKPDITPAH